MRTLFQFGIVSPSRIHFWKLLLWVQCKRPRLFRDAALLSICCYHYRKICEKQGA
jgi:hypothetical protein